MDNRTKILIAIIVTLTIALGFMVGLYFFGGNSEIQPTNQVEETKPVETSPTQPIQQQTPSQVLPQQTIQERATVEPIGPNWIQDNSTGIYLWNPQPTDGESISWSGSYIQDGPYKFADGFGKVIWQKNGRTVQIDEGNFSHGRHNGKFKHQFLPSGNIEYSNWDNGVEIPIQQSRRAKNYQSEVYVGTYRSGLDAYILTDSFSFRGGSDSFHCTIKATGYETVFLEYDFMRSDKGDVVYSNSQGYSGKLGHNTEVENSIWKFAQEYYYNR